MKNEVLKIEFGSSVPASYVMFFRPKPRKQIGPDGIPSVGAIAVCGRRRWIGAVSGAANFETVNHKLLC